MNPSIFSTRFARAAACLRLLYCGALVLALAACNKEAPPSFRGIDLTGANYGRDFHLQDADGRERTLAEFKGKAVLLFFGFTQCPDVCPTALTRAVEVKRLLGADGARLQVIFVTLDPERDTPALLKQYTAAFDPTFLGLHADPETTKMTAREFKVFYTKVPTGDSYTLDHSAFSYVFDPAGRLRLALRHEHTAQDYAADLRQILNNK